MPAQEKKPELYALMVAINNYPKTPLNGCVNDLEAVRGYLESRFPGPQHVKTLTNEAATRKEIIKGFDHFSQAGQDDICFFFYAGHGVRVNAPEAFWHREPDKKLECLLCYYEKGQEPQLLADKELSHLIWENTQKLTPHFVVIMDCCFSGFNTREKDVRFRKENLGEITAGFDGFYGSASYEKEVIEGKTYYNPKYRPHIKLSACRDNQKAREIFLEGTSKGVFTHYLIKSLQQTGRQVTYRELINRVDLQMRPFYKDQYPQLEIFNEGDDLQLFLGGKMAPIQDVFLINFKDKWRVNAGRMHGLPGEGALLVGVDHPNLEMDIKEVKDDHAILEDHPGLDKEKIYKARIKKWKIPRLNLAFSEKNDKKAKALFMDIYRPLKQALRFKIVKKERNADYLIHAENEEWGLYFRTGYRPVFKKLQNFSAPAAEAFIQHINAVAKWTQTLTLSQPQSDELISDKDFSIVLYRMGGLNRYRDEDMAETVDWRKTTSFRYHLQGDRWKEPAFRLKISNISSKPFWVSTLYFASDFGIFNILLEPVELQAEETTWLRLHNKTTIPLNIDKAFYSWGITNLTEYIKVIISTERFNTVDLTQEPLALETPKKRGFGFEAHNDEALTRMNKWAVRDIALNIIKPIELVPFPSGEKTSIRGLHIQAPQGVQGLITLSVLDHGPRMLQAKEVKPALFSFLKSKDKEFTPLLFSESHKDFSGLGQIEIFHLQGKEKINETHPLIIYLPEEASADAKLTPLALNPDLEGLATIGKQVSFFSFHISRLPEPTPSSIGEEIYKGQRLGDSIKIAFHCD